MRGCLDWQRGGLGAPEAVRAATETYREESDPELRFLEDKCDVSRINWNMEVGYL